MASNSNIATLESLARNTKFRIRDIIAGHGLKQRLLQMGFVPGTEGFVINNTGGHVVVYIRNSQVGISKGIAKKIYVEIV